MKLQQLPDSELFNIKEVNIGNEECLFITPRNNFIEWTEDNKIFRSSIWTKNDLSAVSLGWKKFTNLGEKPNFEPINLNNKKQVINIYQKIDGSCLIISKYKGELIIRTRGNLYPTINNNFNQFSREEISIFKKIHPDLFDNDFINTENYSIICEWTTPNNKIVINETKLPTLWLTGIINHYDYSYVPTITLDIFGEKWRVKRPFKFNIEKYQCINDFLINIQKTENIEGVVLYLNDDQTLKKVKTNRYLKIHAFKSKLTCSNLFDLFLEMGFSINESELDVFEWKIAEIVDFECAKEAKQYIDILRDVFNESYQIITEIKNFCDYRIGWDQKTFAKHCLEEYDKTKQYESGIAFDYFKNKEITSAGLKKLIIRLIKEKESFYNEDFNI